MLLGEMTFCPKFTNLHSYPKERQLQKSCVSFGEECSQSPSTKQYTESGLKGSLAKMFEPDKFHTTHFHIFLPSQTSRLTKYNTYTKSFVRSVKQIWEPWVKNFREMYWYQYLKKGFKCLLVIHIGTYHTFSLPPQVSPDINWFATVWTKTHSRDTV